MLYLNPLPLRVTLGEREVAFSYMSRLAQRNGVRTSDFAVDMGLPRRAVARGDAEALRGLAGLGGLPVEVLSGWTPSLVDSEVWRFRGEVLPRPALRLLEIRGCPLCLREDAAVVGDGAGMTLRGDWLVAHVTLCLRHCHPLVHLWSDRAEDRRYDIVHWLSPLAPRVLAGDLDRPRRAATGFDHWLDDRLATGRKSIWLDRFDLYAACLFCELLGVQLGGAVWPFRRDPDGDLRARACDLGFQVAATGEAGIRQALDTLLARARYRNRSPGKVLGRLHVKHEYQLPWPGHDPFRALLRRYVDDKMPWFRSPELTSRRKRGKGHRPA